MTPSLLNRLKSGLARTRQTLLSGFGLFGRRRIDAELFEELETALLTADVGVDTTQWLLDRVQTQVKRQQLTDGAALLTALKEAMVALLAPCDAPLVVEGKPFFVLVIGVNGAGKTTTLGKLAAQYRRQDKQVLIAAGDTFRAAAGEQLQAWATRADADFIGQAQGADAAALIFDAFQAARARQMEVLLADTAGRLQNKAQLMGELQKIQRVVKRLDAAAPHEVLLVLDGSSGQNALSQAKLFHEAVGVTGLVITKLDGTAKGGMALALAHQLPLPIRFIGVGEGIDDLQPFNRHAFVDALFD